MPRRPALVDRAAQTFTRTNGNLREVVRTIVTSPEFFAPAAYRAKVKTPFEFVVSALRATDADVRQATATRARARGSWHAALPVPAADWIRRNGRHLGLLRCPRQSHEFRAGDRRRTNARHFGQRSFDDGVDSARQRIVRNALAGDVSTSTLETIAKGDNRRTGGGAGIGSPEFQRQ